MTDLRQAAQAALENLEAVLCDPEGRAGIHGSDGDLKIIDEALDGLRAALAAQPVAWTDDQMARFAWTCSAPALDAGSIMDRLRAFREYEATRGRAIPAAQAQQAAPFTPGELVKMNEAWLHRRSMGLHDPEAIPVVQPVADICTDPYNCKRCKTHPNHRGDLPHAGIGWYPAAQPQQDAECKPYGDLRNAKWLDPECYGAGACQSLKFKAAQQAAQPVAQEPIHIEAVAEVVLDDDDVPTLRWLVEGGIADLPAGMVLMISDLPLTDDYGSGEVFRASQPQQAPLKERPDFVAGYDAGLADGRRIAEREQAAQPVALTGDEKAALDRALLRSVKIVGEAAQPQQAEPVLMDPLFYPAISAQPQQDAPTLRDQHKVFADWWLAQPMSIYHEPPENVAWAAWKIASAQQAAQPQQAISAPAQIDLSNEWPTTRYFVKQVMARFGIGPNEDIASALRKLYAEAPAQPQQTSPNSSST